MESYDSALLSVSKRKKPELIALDAWLHDELKRDALARLPSPHITLAELSKLMTWKITRGKFRPLQKLCDSNNAKDVATRSAKAIELLQTNEWSKAMAELETLKAIGPATASLFLSLFEEQGKLPFMADEALEGCGCAREYTRNEYSEFQRRCLVKAKELSHKSKRKWTAAEVSTCLWTAATLASSFEELEQVKEGGGERGTGGSDEKVNKKRKRG